MNSNISFDYVRGLVEGEGCFTFCLINKDKSGNYKQKIPTFSLQMTDRDSDLINSVRDKIGLKNTVYEYKPRIRSDGYKRMGMSVLVVRDFGQIKNIVVPLLYKKLIGSKAVQFEEWISIMETDPLVSQKFKLIGKLYRNGFYDTNFKKFE